MAPSPCPSRAGSPLDRFRQTGAAMQSGLARHVDTEDHTLTGEHERVHQEAAPVQEDGQISVQQTGFGEHFMSENQGDVGTNVQTDHASGQAHSDRVHPDHAAAAKPWVLGPSELKAIAEQVLTSQYLHQVMKTYVQEAVNEALQNSSPAAGGLEERRRLSNRLANVESAVRKMLGADSMPQVPSDPNLTNLVMLDEKELKPTSQLSQPEQLLENVGSPRTAPTRSRQLSAAAFNSDPVGRRPPLRQPMPPPQQQRQQQQQQQQPRSQQTAWPSLPKRATMKDIEAYQNSLIIAESSLGEWMDHAPPSPRLRAQSPRRPQPSGPQSPRNSSSPQRPQTPWRALLPQRSASPSGRRADASGGSAPAAANRPGACADFTDLQQSTQPSSEGSSIAIADDDSSASHTSPSPPPTRKRSGRLRRLFGRFAHSHQTRN